MVSLALEPVLMIAGRRDHSQASGRRQPSRGCFVGRGRDVARGSVGRAWAVGCGLWAVGCGLLAFVVRFYRDCTYAPITLGSKHVLAT